MSEKSIGQKCAEAIYNWDARDHYVPPPAIIAQIIDDMLESRNTPEATSEVLPWACRDWSWSGQ